MGWCMRRRVVHTQRWAVRYCDGMTARQARLHTEAMLTMDMVARGFRVGKVREVRDLDRLLRYEVEVTALV